MSIRSTFRPFGAALALILASLPAAPAAKAQQVVRTGETGEPLDRRVASAVQQAIRGGDSAMVGYGIVVRAPANEIWGMYSFKDTSHPTLSELLDGRSTDHRPDGNSEQLVERRAAVMITLDRDGHPTDVQLLTFDSIAHFDADTIYWLGDTSREGSFDLLLEYAGNGFVPDVRRGAVYSLARHGMPERALPVLSGLTRNRSEPQELRKAAVYGLGMLGTDAARRVLMDLIYEETS